MNFDSIYLDAIDVPKGFNANDANFLAAPHPEYSKEKILKMIYHSAKNNLFNLELKSNRTTNHLIMSLETYKELIVLGFRSIPAIGHTDTAKIHSLKDINIYWDSVSYNEEKYTRQ